MCRRRAQSCALILSHDCRTLFVRILFLVLLCWGWHRRWRDGVAERGCRFCSGSTCRRACGELKRQAFHNLDSLVVLRFSLSFLRYYGRWRQSGGFFLAKLVVFASTCTCRPSSFAWYLSRGRGRASCHILRLLPSHFPTRFALIGTMVVSSVSPKHFLKSKVTLGM